MDSHIGRRIVVLGSSGSGKTTLARHLARMLGIPHVELDALHWEANWTEAADEVFRARVTNALRGDAWVVDGNYSTVRDIIWAQADTLVWLDYTLGLILRRLARRTLRRVFTREELWNGNRESLRNALSPNDNSVFVWAIKNYKKRRRDYPILFSQPQHAHLQVIHLHTPRQTEQWLADVD